jgi:hypothetical protein
LASQLLTSQVYAASDAQLRRHTAVWNDYRAWDAKYREPTELYLRRLYRERLTWDGARLWTWAVELLAAVLATPRHADRAASSPRYLGRITSPVRNAIHEDFWAEVLASTELASVITTNYDILAERGLRHRPTLRPVRPGVFYGGLSRPQLLKGSASPFTTREDLRQIELTGSVPIYKLHGSLNWTLDGSRVLMYQDLRPAFRHGGEAAVIPPVDAKTTPHWLEAVWRKAGQTLSDARLWIVVGYSLPAYDAAVRELLLGAARGVHVILVDPNSDRLRDWWSSALPGAYIHPLPGLPEALGEIEDAVTRIGG